MVRPHPVVLDEKLNDCVNRVLIVGGVPHFNTSGGVEPGLGRF